MDTRRIGTDATGGGGGRGRARPTAAGMLFVALLFAYGLYATGFIYRTSFVIDGRRYFCLFDDAMISMRYARNLAHGDGLVWNPGGERVQGFTAPLWTLYMSAWHLLPIPDRLMSLPIQITGGVCVLLSLVFVRRLALLLSGGSQLAALSAAALTAFYLPLNNWSLQGMEVGAIALLLAAASSLLVAGEGRAHRPFPSFSYVLLGAAVLVRMDASALVAAATLWGAATDRTNRKSHILWGVGTLVATVGGQAVFGLLYYGDPLPNTYYLKMTGYPASLRALRGWLCLVEFARHAPWWMLALGLAPLAWRRDRGVILLATLFLVQCAYSVYVGGDAWEWWGGANRYVTVAMPLLFVLLSVALADGEGWAVGQLGERRGRPGPVARGTAVGLAVTCLMASNRFSATSAGECLLQAPALNCAMNAANVELGRVVREATTEEALVAVGWAGATPYFGDRRCHDLLGRCDRRIAHQPARVAQTRRAVRAFIPGHVKYDFDYSVLELRPDLVLHDVSHGERESDLLSLYEAVRAGPRRIWARRGSERVRWQILAPMGEMPNPPASSTPRTAPPPAARHEL